MHYVFQESLYATDAETGEILYVLRIGSPTTQETHWFLLSDLITEDFLRTADARQTSTLTTDEHAKGVE